MFLQCVFVFTVVVVACAYVLLPQELAAFSNIVGARQVLAALLGARGQEGWMVVAVAVVHRSRSSTQLVVSGSGIGGRSSSSSSSSSRSNSISCSISNSRAIVLVVVGAIVLVVEVVHRSRSSSSNSINRSRVTVTSCSISCYYRYDHHELGPQASKRLCRDLQCSPPPRFCQPTSGQLDHGEERMLQSQDKEGQEARDHRAGRQSHMTSLVSCCCCGCGGCCCCCCGR